MINETHDLVIIGGGPSGLSAAYGAYQNGIKDILVIERDHDLGGILNQCIHNGFGLHRFKEELTGPEYAARYIDLVKSTEVKIKSDTMVLDFDENKVLHVISSKEGYQTIKAKAIILSMGCRERSRGAISLPGTRPAGIFTAGAAQKYVNMDGLLVGKRVVILGSGDIGLIMARRMTLEGAKVLADVELMPYSNGLNRNVVQCLEDYNIPLYLSHTVTDIIGEDRLEKVVISKVDENRVPIKGSEIEFECDTLLLSVGLIPENELSRKANIEIDRRTNGPIVADNLETSLEGVFACGNVLHVHDLVDNVSMESEKAGKEAAKYILEGESRRDNIIEIKNGNGVSYTVPQYLRKDAMNDQVEIFFRVRQPDKNKKTAIVCGDKVLTSKVRLHLAPGEMESIIIKKSQLEGIEGPITVEVREMK